MRHVWICSREFCAGEASGYVFGREAEGAPIATLGMGRTRPVRAVGCEQDSRAVTPDLAAEHLIGLSILAPARGPGDEGPAGDERMRAQAARKEGIDDA